MVKRILKMLVVCAVLLMLAPIKTEAATAYSGNVYYAKLKWNISDDGVFSITLNGTNKLSSVLIKSRNKIPWKDYKSYIKSVDISSSYTITNMDYWFYECENLETVTSLPSGVESMRETFSRCSSLTTAPEISSSVTEMGNTFAGCSSLTKAPAIPSGVTGMYATFSRCSSLTTAPEIPSSVTDIRSTFDGCRALATAPEIPSSVTNINSTFSGCSSLTAAPEIPSSVTDMSNTFAGCSSLTKAPEIPSSVTNMGKTFYGCKSLTTAPTMIPSGVTNMDSTFYDCKSLTTVPEIPSSVTNMSSTFEGCSSLTTAPEISSGVTYMNSTFSGCSSLITAPTIPSGVTNMPSTFSGCKSLTAAPEIPSSVTNINSTFSGCSSLTAAPEIPSSVTDMSNTFAGCSSLTKAPEIPSSVTNMWGTFDRCSSLKSIDLSTLNSSCKVDYLLDRCWNLQKVITPINSLQNTLKLPDPFARASDRDTTFEICPSGTDETIYKVIAVSYYVDWEKKGTINQLYTLPLELPPSPSKTGFIFNYWANDNPYGEQLTTNTIFDGTLHEMHANFTEATTYTISFDSNGGSACNNLSVNPNSPYTLPTTSQTGYTFNGWYSGNTKWTDGIYTIMGDTELTAHWIPNIYTVNFNLNGATSGTVSPMTCTYDQNYTIPTSKVIKKGWHFKGWALTPNGEVVYAPGDSFSNLSSVNGDEVTLYAVWEQATFTVAMPTSINLNNSAAAPTEFTGSFNINVTSDLDEDCQADVRFTEITPDDRSLAVTGVAKNDIIDDQKTVNLKKVMTNAIKYNSKIKFGFSIVNK